MPDRPGGDASTNPRNLPVPRPGVSFEPARADDAEALRRIRRAGAVATARPMEVGGTVAKAVGWVVLVAGTLTALLLGSLFQAIFPAGVVGWVLGGIIGMLSLAAGVTLVSGGGLLRKAGTKRLQDARLASLQALAARQGGVLTADDAARELRMPAADADALLESFVKAGDDRVRLEVDDEGRLLYLFEGAPGPARLRIGEEAARGRIASEMEAAEEEAEAAASGRARARS